MASFCFRKDLTLSVLLREGFLGNSFLCRFLSHRPPLLVRHLSIRAPFPFSA